MPEPATPWPHAPSHQLSEKGTYFVTAGTYLKAHYFRTPQCLDVLQWDTAVSRAEFSLASWSAAVFRRSWIVRSLLRDINPADSQTKLEYWAV
jgi:hypothetical protein